MEFLKKNYEKVVLSVVLLGLAVAAVFLFLSISSEKSRLEEVENMDVRMQMSLLEPLNLSTNEETLSRVKRPEPLRLSREHNLFNPVVWQRRGDGTLVKIVTGSELGPGALTITKITPLKLIISYEGSSTNFGTQLLHSFKVTREGNRDPRKRAPVTRQASGVGAKNDIFSLREMRPPDAPTEFVLELEEDNSLVTVSKDKPYEGVDGYMADLRYEPDKLVFANKRIDERLLFAGDTNKIVAIQESSVTVEASSNRKRTKIVSPGTAR